MDLVVLSPLDKEKLDGLLDEIKNLKGKSLKSPRRFIYSTPVKIDKETSATKKDFLLSTEKKAYFLFNHYFRVVMSSIGDIATALQIWVRGVLPLLLTKHGLDLEEWERIVGIGDNDSQLQEELDDDWKAFLKNTIEKGQVDTEILTLIDEGKIRVKKMREG